MGSEPTTSLTNSSPGAASAFSSVAYRKVAYRQDADLLLVTQVVVWCWEFWRKHKIPSRSQRVGVLLAEHPLLHLERLSVWCHCLNELPLRAQRICKVLRSSSACRVALGRAPASAPRVVVLQYVVPYILSLGTATHNYYNCLRTIALHKPQRQPRHRAEVVYILQKSY